MQSTTKCSLFTVLGFTLVFLLGGCAIALDTKRAGYISTVAINKDVRFANSASHQTTGNTMAGVFGGVFGALIASAATAGYRQELTEVFDAESRLGEVITDCLTEAVNSHPSWSVRIIEDSKDADAVFDILIYEYGFSTSGSKTAMPILGITLSLTDKTGKELWRSGSSIAKHPPDLPRYQLENYLEDMTRYDSAAASHCKELMSQFIKPNK